MIKKNSLEMNIHQYEPQDIRLNFFYISIFYIITCLVLFVALRPVRKVFKNILLIIDVI